MKTNQEKLLATLKRMGACNASREWVKDKNIRTFREAWRRCPHADWMEWLATHLAHWGQDPERFDLRFQVAEDKFFFAAEEGYHKAVKAELTCIRRTIPFRLLEPLIRKAQQ